MDFIYERMNDDTEQIPEEAPESEIKAFFSGKTIFLTGSTGFIGKCLVEKILRTCSDIQKLYILVRAKSNKSIEKRMNDYFNNMIFQKLRIVNPNFMEKVAVIEGDLSLPGIALSPENRQLLIETVDLIIHNAAMVIFTAKISTILSTNVLGTKEMLDLATECHHLKGFMHVSTAFSHCYLKTIEEKFYKPPADLQIVHDMIKADMENEAGLSKDVVKSLLGPCPNVYIFTKAIGESIVQEYAKKVSFPCGIFRMSIVMSTYKEPLRSWCGNANGPTFILMAAGLGIVHVMCISKDGPPDLIPADMTANACLASLWDLVENKKDCKEGCIYNFGSSTHNPTDYPTLRNNVTKYGANFPSISTMGLFFIFFTNNYPLFMLGHIVFHYIPAFVVDLLRLLRLKKMKYVPLLWKIGKHMNEVLYFATRHWYIKTDQMSKVWDRMNPTDCKFFFNDLRKLDWDKFFETYWQGLRVYLLKEPLENAAAARRRYNLVSVGSAIFYSLIIFLIGYTIFSVISLFV